MFFHLQTSFCTFGPDTVHSYFRLNPHYEDIRFLVVYKGRLVVLDLLSVPCLSNVVEVIWLYISRKEGLQYKHEPKVTERFRRLKVDIEDEERI